MALAATRMLRLSPRATETETPLPVIFDLMAGLLQHLPAEAPQPQAIFAFELKLLTELGLKPELEKTKLNPGTKQMLKALTEFQEMGITIAIDDFGTGYSALSYLTRFPIDTLKIDRSFISRLTEYGHQADLVKAIISMAHSLEQHVVAEGVETVEQQVLLQRYGCHTGQGYLYSKPISKSAFELLPLLFGQEAVAA